MGSVQGKQFGLAVIGCGRWGINHVRAASEVLGPCFIAYCDADANALLRAGVAAPQALAKGSFDFID